MLFLCSARSLFWLKSRLKSQHTPFRWEKAISGTSAFISWSRAEYKTGKFFHFSSGKLFWKWNCIYKKLCSLFEEKNDKEWLLTTQVEITLAVKISRDGDSVNFTDCLLLILSYLLNQKMKEPPKVSVLLAWKTESWDKREAQSKKAQMSPSRLYLLQNLLKQNWNKHTGTLTSRKLKSRKLTRNRG